MKLNAEQQKKVEENMRLVGKVIKDKVHGLEQGIYSYEDLRQVGYIGLCKAAYTDRGGCFSTFAYRLIWQEICDALIKANNQYKNDQYLASVYKENGFRTDALVEMITSAEIADALRAAEQRAGSSEQKGIKALRYISEGYNSREIGIKMNASAGSVRVWITRAKKFLLSQPEIQELA